MATSPESVEIYCLKYRAKTGSRDVEQVTLKTDVPPFALFALCAAQANTASAPPDEPGPPGGPPAAPVSCGAPGSATSALANVQCGIAGPGLSAAYRKPSRSKPLSGDAVPLPVSAAESRIPSIELRSPGRSLRTATPSGFPGFTMVGSWLTLCRPGAPDDAGGTALPWNQRLIAMAIRLLPLAPLIGHQGQGIVVRCVPSASRLKHHPIEPEQ